MPTATKNKTLPKHKPSGIDWLGDIPDGWEVKKLKHVSDIILGKMLQNEDGGGDFIKPYLKAQNIRWEFVDLEDVQEMWFSPTEMMDYRVQANDLLVSEGGEVGRTAIWRGELEECYIQNSVHIVRVNEQKTNNRFILFLLESLAGSGVFDATVNRVSIAHLTRDKLKEVVILNPSVAEQRTIADFLDRKTAKIDEMVAKKQRMMELLKEKRQALITHSVTKGLDPKAKMEPSGIDWLGDIPEGWEVKRLKYVARSNVSSLAESTDKEYLFRYLDIGNVGTGYVLEEPAEVYFENAPSRARRIVKKDDTIISTVRTYLKAIYYFENGPNGIIVSTGFAVIEVGKTIDPKFFYYLSLSESFIDSIVSNSYGVSYPAINESFLMTLPVWYPKIEEQKEIVVFLDRETVKIDEMMKKVEMQIEKLQEYRQALITNAVTGKIAVN